MTPFLSSEAIEYVLNILKQSFLIMLSLKMTNYLTIIIIIQSTGVKAMGKS